MHKRPDLVTSSITILSVHFYSFYKMKVVLKFKNYKAHKCKICPMVKVVLFCCINQEEARQLQFPQYILVQECNMAQN